MARAQSPCKQHSHTVSCTANAPATASESKAAKGGADGAPAGPVAPVSPLSPLAPVSPLSPLAPAAPAAPVSPLSPFAPSFPAAPARAQTSAMRWAALHGRCHDRLRADRNCPSTPKPHTIDGSAQSAHDKQRQHRPKKRTAGSVGFPGNAKDVSTTPIPGVPAAPVGPVAPATPSPMQQQLGPWHLPTLRCPPSE